MAIETFQPIGPVLLTAAASTLYTAPAAAGSKAVIVKLHIVNGSALLRTLSMSYGADAAATRIYDQFPIPGRDFLDDTGPYVLNAGGTLRGFADLTSVLVVTGTVVEIT